MASGYCMRCKSKKEMKNAKIAGTNKNGTQRISGVCPDCGTKMNTFQSGGKSGQGVLNDLKKLGGPRGNMKAALEAMLN